MFQETYLIFGRQTRVHFNDSVGSLILQKELSIYPKVAASKKIDLEIFHQSEMLCLQEESINPSIHQELKDGFIADFGSAKVKFTFNHLTLNRIDFQLKQTSSKIKKIIQKFKNIQFSSVEESIGQIFHELILVPSVYFQTDQLLLHASAFKSNQGETILIGGTGGVGKTSLELESCLHNSCKFIADDICVVSKKGLLWPNLSYPKIYAYNVENNHYLTKQILQGSSLTNRLHWTINRKRGKSKVRRRISPQDLYGSYLKEKTSISKYIILARAKRRAIEIEKLSPEIAMQLSIPIIKAEYSIFNQHILWHQFNSYLQNKDPYIDLHQTILRWHKTGLKALHNSQCLLVTIPLEMTHRQFKDKLAFLIKQSI